jgi:hypothetical protein
MRLKQYPPNSTLSRFNAFFNSPVWVSMLHEKFGLESAATKTDNGLQKYLDGYEISPHPDIRQKALTLHDQHQPFCFV